MSKQAELLALTHLRQKTRWPGYACIGDYHGGAYECHHVSPYTKSASNVDADVMILLQDWSSHERLSGPIDRDAVRFGHTPSLPTNKRLGQLLKTHLGLELADTYATNLFPFIKMGGLSESLPMRDLVRAAREFALPQIRIVSSRLVICLGLVTFNAMRVALEHRRCPRLPDAIAAPVTLGSTSIWCQAHTGALGQNGRNRDGVDRVSGDWSRMAASLVSPRRTLT